MSESGSKSRSQRPGGKRNTPPGSVLAKRERELRQRERERREREIFRAGLKRELFAWAKSDTAHIHGGGYPGLVGWLRAAAELSPEEESQLDEALRRSRVQRPIVEMKGVTAPPSTLVSAPIESHPIELHRSRVQRPIVEMKGVTHYPYWADFLPDSLMVFAPAPPSESAETAGVPAECGVPGCEGGAECGHVRIL